MKHIALSTIVRSLQPLSLLYLLVCFFPCLAQAQEYTMKITLNDGTTKRFNISDLQDITFEKVEQDTPELLKGLTGQWLLIASNEGEEVAPGVYRAGTDTISFTATAAADGTSLLCHTDRMYWRSNTVYAADWRIIVEQDGTQRRLGWVLDDQQPAWSDGTTHLYLLSENSDASAWLGMTFWSAWSNTSATTYTLSNEEHNSRKVYGLLSKEIPFANPTGMLEIWSSPRFEKLP